jgi:hypothetical protein
MDNILKLLLSVLGIAGLIAFVTSNLSFEPQAPAVALPPPVVVDGPPVGEEGLNEEGFEEESPEEDGEDVFAIGEPMIDGNPYGSNNQQQQQQFDPSQSGNFNYAQPAQPNYSQDQVFAPQPPPGTFIPVNSGE